MKCHSQAEMFSQALAGLSRTFQSAAGPADDHREIRGHTVTHCKPKPPSDAEVRQLAAMLEKGVAAYARIEEMTARLLGTRGVIPELAPALLARHAESPQGAFLRSPGAANDLALLASFFAEVDGEYLRAVGTPIVDVDIGGRIRADAVEILVPKVPDGSSWDVLSSGATSSHVWLILNEITDVRTRVRIRFTWAGDESVTVSELALEGPQIWTRTAYPTGATWSSRTGMVLRSGRHIPIAGTVALRAEVAVEAISRWAHHLSLTIDLGEARSAPPVRPHEITVGDGQPTPAWRPTDLASLEPAERRALLELFGDFFADNMRAIREIANVIGTERLSPELLRSAVELASMR